MYTVTRLRRAAIGLLTAFLLLTILVQVHTLPASASEGNDHLLSNIGPEECLGATTLKTFHRDSTQSKTELRYSAACGGVWVRKSNGMDWKDRNVFIVGYTCEAADASCREGWKRREMDSGGGWTYMLDTSKFDAYRVCIGRDDNPPFSWCSDKITLPFSGQEWVGKASPPEGYDQPVKVTWHDGRVCARPLSNGNQGFKLEITSKSGEIHSKSNSYPTIDIAPDPFCVLSWEVLLDSIKNPQHSPLKKIELRQCVGLACGEPVLVHSAK